MRAGAALARSAPFPSSNNRRWYSASTLSARRIRICVCSVRMFAPTLAERTFESNPSGCQNPAETVDQGFGVAAVTGQVPAGGLVYGPPHAPPQERRIHAQQSLVTGSLGMPDLDFHHLGELSVEAMSDLLDGGREAHRLYEQEPGGPALANAGAYEGGDAQSGPLSMVSAGRGGGVH